MTNTAIHTIVLRRVRIAYYLNLLLSGTTLSGLLWVASIYLLAREVWVSKVIENMPRLTDVSSVATFYGRAFANTDLLVQALLVLALSAGLVFALRVRRVVLVGPRFA